MLLHKLWSRIASKTNFFANKQRPTGCARQKQLFPIIRVKVALSFSLTTDPHIIGHFQVR